MGNTPMLGNGFFVIYSNIRFFEEASVKSIGMKLASLVSGEWMNLALLDSVLFLGAVLGYCSWGVFHFLAGF
jgi:hypothetical protein